MEFTQLQASLRSQTGKGSARRLRRQGRTPAVLYGSSVETVSLSVSPKELITALSGPLHTNTVLALSISGAPDATTEYKVMVRDHQFDPATRELLHVDFLTVELEKKIQVNIPLKLTGRSKGEQAGGELVVVFRSMPIMCLPANIPDSFSVDVTNLEINDSITVKGLNLPEDIEVSLPSDATVILVQAAKAEEEEEVEEDAEAVEGEAVQEGEEAEAADKPSKAPEEKTS
ncbi:MAG: 50S ribosomal protein L25 [Proteobacteria bacterium]|nr:50S ribosomal protein L25 [Pseudomonadota bacterium]